MKPCVCGCNAAVHEHHRLGTDCGTCGRVTCPRYRRRRWWRRAPDVPAAVSVQQALPPEPAPPPGPPSPPGQPVRWAIDVHYLEAPCGCFELTNNIKGKRRTWRCETHAFEHHWEERLRQS